MLKWLINFFIVFCIVWVIPTLLVCKACIQRYHRRSKWKLIGIPVLVYLVPVLSLLGFVLGFGYLFELDKYTRMKDEYTDKPTEVYGAIFPPKSRATYELSGSFFDWCAKRTFIAIESPSSNPVLLGNVLITSIRPSTNNTAWVRLSENQTINGWPCEMAIVNLTPTGLKLDSCWLAKPLRWGGRLLPERTYIKSKPSGGGAEPDKK